MNKYEFVWFADEINGNKIVNRKYIDHEYYCCEAFTLKHALVKLLLDNIYFITTGIDVNCFVIGLYHFNQFCDGKEIDFNYTNKVQKKDIKNIAKFMIML